MPNYDFTCQACNHSFTEMVPIAERDEPRSCPSCGKKKVARDVSAVKLSYSGFKSNIARAGSGWNDMLKKVKKGSGRDNSIHTR